MTRYISLLFFISILLAGCEKEGESIDTEFTSYQISVVYPNDFSDLANFTATFDGQNISKTLFPGKGEQTGTLKLIYQDYNVFEQQVTLKSGEAIRVILLPGKIIKLYSEQDYIPFNGSFILNSGYVAKLNGQELVDGLNYIHKDKANGDIEFYKRNNEQESLVATMHDVAIVADMKINIMQLEETTFIEIPEDEEPDPSSNKILKARFLYLGDEVLSMDKVRMDFFVHDDWCWAFFAEPVATITLEKGKLSDYIVLDYSFKEPDLYGGCTAEAYGYSFYYDVVDPVSQTIIADHNNYVTSLGINNVPTIDYMSWTYKKGTFILKDSGNACNFQSGLSTPWE